MFDATVEAFIAWEKEHDESIKLKRSYVELTGDLNAGILLSQIIYWHLPDKNGKSKLRVWKHGEFWLAKKRDDWWEECCLTPKQFDRAIAILEEKGLVNCGLFRFSGSPTKHIQLKWENLLNSLKALCRKFLPKSQNPNHSKVKIQVDEKGKTLTETTAEITPEITGRVIRGSRATSVTQENTGISVSEKTLSDRPLSFSKNGNVAMMEKNAIENPGLSSKTVNQSGSGESKPEKKKECPAILPRNKTLEYDDNGWVILPTRHKRHQLACKLAIRRTQLWLVRTYFDCVEISQEDGKPYFYSKHSGSEGFEEEFFASAGDHSLGALRNYALAHKGMQPWEYNEKLEELFWDSVEAVAEDDRWVSATLNDGTVSDDFEE